MKTQWKLVSGLMLAVLLGATEAPPMTTSAPGEVPPADQPLPRMDPKTHKPSTSWMKRHDGLVEQAKKGGVDLYFEGDSITDFWTNKRRKGNGLEVWNKEFTGWHPGNWGISADRTEHVLWRIENGELDGVKPKAIVLMIGTNNSGDCTSEEIAKGVTAIVNELKEKEPQAKILLLAIFPRNDESHGVSPEHRREVNAGANAIIAKLDDGKQVKFLDINSKFPDPTSAPDEFKAVFSDNLHPNAKGYQIWADAIKPVLTEWLGPPEASKDVPAHDEMQVK